MMVPSMVEKFAYVLTMVVLYMQGRVLLSELVAISPDLVWGTLFAIAFAKTSNATPS